MITGSKKSLINFDKFEVYDFKPQFNQDYGWKTCGSATLSLITGIRPSKIEKYLKKQKHWGNAAVMEFLRKKGYVVHQVTKNSVLRKVHFEYNPLNERHVLLCNQEVDEKEASWFLTYAGKVWHNFYEVRINHLHYLNKPPQNIFIVWHKNWN